MTLTVDQQVPLSADEHGVLRVGHTRVSLDSIVIAYVNGATAEQIADDFPSLDLADIHTVIGYYLKHREEVADYLHAQETKADDVRREVDPIVAKADIRQRLLARRASQERTNAPSPQ